MNCSNANKTEVAFFCYLRHL